MKLFKKLALAAAASAALSLNVQAAPVSSVLEPGLNLLSDNSAEYLIKGANNVNGSQIEIGDRLRGIFNIDTVEVTGAQTALGANGVNELTGIFEIEVRNVVTIGQPLYAGSFLNCASAFCFDFGPSAGFAAEMAGLGFANVPGAMVAFFEDSTIDYNRLIDTGNKAADIAAMEATATGGSPFWLAGFDATNPFDFWTAGAQTNDISVATLFNALTPFGQFALGVSLLDNPNGPDLGLVDCTNTNATLALLNGTTNFCGNGGLLAKGPVGGASSFATAYDSLDDVNFSINVIPMPAPLALLGLGLLGLALQQRRNALAA